MGTCKEDPQEQQEAQLVPMVEENFTSGPPASRTVIDNLKKLLVQRQHSRESDYENKNAVTRSTSGSNSDTAFFSQFSTSSSESDSDSDSYLIFEDISNQENRKSNGSRRRHRRQRSYSSSSSSSRSPVEKRRRKPIRIKNSLTGTDGHGCTSGSKVTTEPHNDTSCTKAASMEEDSANSTSSHKDSSSDADDENMAAGNPDGSGGLNSSTSRYPKFKTRRDRNRKRRRSETNYANNRPNIRNSVGNPSLIPTIVISHTDNDVNNDLSPISQQHQPTNIVEVKAATSGTEIGENQNTALETADKKPDENITKLQ